MLLHQQFVRMAKKHAGKLAIIDKTTKRNITYSKALIASLIIASKFNKFDEGFIGIMIPTSAGCALAVIGALMSGRIPVMINYSTGAERNSKYAQKKCNFKTIVTSKALLDKINCPMIEGMVLIENILKTITTADKLKAALIAQLPTNLLFNCIHKGNENDTAFILFTSGSEKDPKAVQLSHKNISANIDSTTQFLNLVESDSTLSILVFYHIFGLTVSLWIPLYTGMTMITYANPLDFKTVCKIAAEEKPTLMAGTPSFYWGYLHNSQPGDFSSLRVMVASADKCPDALREGFLREHGVTLLEGYGTTETSPVVSITSHEYHKPGSIGKVIPNVQVRIENFATGEDCAPNEVGKIMVKGDLVMKGYFDAPELNAEAIQDGWYNTGDMGYFDADQYLWHAGRFKRFVKIGSEMISLVKVEDILETFLPENVQCCVVEVANKFKGSNIVAVVTEEVDKKEILNKMELVLSNIALPKRFIVLDELPMMSSGKIDFRGVTRIAQEKIGK